MIAAAVYVVLSSLASLLVRLTYRRVGAASSELLAWIALLFPLLLAVCSAVGFGVHQITVEAAAPAFQGGASVTGSLLSTAPTLSTVGLAIWLAVAAVLLVRDALRSRHALGHLRRVRVTDPDLLATAALVCSRIGVERDIIITQTARLRVPVAIGQSEVCLPAALPASDVEAVLAHEIAHLARRDPHRLLIARALARIGWFQPTNRWLVDVLTNTSEALADRRALAAVDRFTLAAALLHFAAPRSGSTRRVVPTALSGGSVGARIRLLVDSDDVMVPARPSVVLATALGALLIAATPRVRAPELMPSTQTVVGRATRPSVARAPAKREPSKRIARSAKQPLPERVPANAEAASDADVVAALEALLADPSPQVRDAAHRSLQR